MTKLEQLIKELCPNGVELIKLGDVCKFYNGDRGKNYPSHADYCEKGVPFINAGDLENGSVNLEKCNYISEEKYNSMGGAKLQDGDIIYCLRGSIGKNGIYHSNQGTVASSLVAIRPNDIVCGKYIYYLLNSTMELKQRIVKDNGAAQPNLSAQSVKEYLFPMPPLEVQSEIVKILDEYTASVTALQQELEKELNARKKQYEYYRDLLLDFGVHGEETSECERRTFKELFKIEMCRRVMKNETLPQGEIPFYQNGTLGKEAKLYLSRETYNKYIAISKLPKKGAVMLSTAGTIGRTVRYDGEEAYYQDSNIVWINNDERYITNDFLHCFCRSFPWKVPVRGTLKHLHNYMIEDTPIPIPSFEEQKRIVSILDRFDKLCNDIFEGLPAEIEARRKQYEYYRDKLLSFEEL